MLDVLLKIIVKTWMTLSPYSRAKIKKLPHVDLLLKSVKRFLGLL